MKRPNSSEDDLYPSEWNTVFAYFVPIYEEVKLSRAPLPLSQASRTTLQTIILHHEARKRRLEATTTEIMEAPKRLWEEVALRNHGAITSILLEGNMRINLREWNMIVDTFSTEDRNILDQWAHQYENLSARKLKIPLPDFHDIASRESE